jgi:hypothetical protein
MLLQKPLEAGDVLTIKMITGEELIAKLVSINPDNVVISKPLIVNLGQDRNGNVGIQMLPYFILTGDPDAKLTISNQHIIVKTAAAEQAKAGYLQTTTGLTVATTNVPTGLTK